MVVTMFRQTADALLSAFGRLVLRVLDTTGITGQYEDAGGQIWQSGDIDRMEQYGFASHAPAGTEGVVCSDDPNPSVHDRCIRPSALPSLGDGESAQYGPSGNSYVRCHGTVTVRSASGSKVNMGRGGAAQPVARKTDPVAAATTMATWISKVNTVCVAIDPTIVAPTDFGTISDGSPNVESD